MFRVNLRVLVLFIDRDMGQLYMQDTSSTGQSYLEATISSTFPLSASTVAVFLTGLSVDYQGQMVPAVLCRVGEGVRAVECK